MDLRVFAGHSGWSARQVEAEIAAGDWLVLDADARDPFSATPDKLWSQVLRRRAATPRAGGRRAGRPAAELTDAAQ